MGEEDTEIRLCIKSLLKTPTDVRNDPKFMAYDDLVLADSARGEFLTHYITPLRDKKCGAQPGLLLHGPPGTGKTVIAYAIAVASNTNFLFITSADVLSKWQGRAEKTMRAIITVALENTPCVIFFDECDKLLQSAAATSHGDSDSSFANQFKAQVNESVLEHAGVVIICATNYLGRVDEAVISRLGKANVFELPPLNDEQRAELFQRELPSGHQLSLEDVMELVTKIGGGGLRELKGVLRSAKKFADRDGVNLKLCHLKEALKRLERGEDALERARRDEAPERQIHGVAIHARALDESTSTSSSSM